MTALSSAAAVAAENVRLRAEIARLRNLTLLPEIGPEPDFDTPIVDKFTCPGCHEELSAEDAADLCKNCDDDPPLPIAEYGDGAPYSWEAAQRDMGGTE